MVLSHRVGLDRDCLLCQAFSEWILPGDYDYDIAFGSDVKWQLRAFSLRNMLLDSRMMNMFGPLPAAVLHASDNDRAFISHAQDADVEMKGFLVFARTRDLDEYLSASDIDITGDDDNITQSSQSPPSSHDEDEVEDDEPVIYAKSGFINKEYNPAMVKHWISLCGSGRLDSASSHDLVPNQDGLNDDDALAALEDSCQREQTHLPVASEIVGIEGIRVIDCKTHEIVSWTRGMFYVALSYVWRLAHEDMVSLDIPVQVGVMSSSRGTLPSIIPRVVHSAMQVTTDLDYRYLWVDQFCIDQTATRKEIAEHISKMDLIYSCSVLTIVAASSGGALPGVGSTARTAQLLLHVGVSDERLDSTEEEISIFTTPPPLNRVIKEQVWFTRGWCFQESLLSPRRLYFTDHQIMFESEHLHACDVYPEPSYETEMMLFWDFKENPSLAWPVAWATRLEEANQRCEYDHDDPRGIFWTEMFIYFGLLETYTGKELTCSSDAIYGFLGAMKVFTRHDPCFQIFQGIPILNISEASRRSRNACWDECSSFAMRLFSIALEWEHVGKSIRRYEFPSWSWAGWQGQVRWDGRLNDSSDLTVSLTILEVEDTDAFISNIFDAYHLSQPCILIANGTLIPRYLFLFYHEWRSMPKAIVEATRVPYHAQRLHPDLLEASDGIEQAMAARIEAGSWACILLNYVQLEPSTMPTGVTLLVVEWDSSTRCQNQHSDVAILACTRVGLLRVHYEGDKQFSFYASLFASFKRVRIRLG